MDPEYTDRFLHTIRASATPEGALHTAYEAVISGDFDAFGASLADDVELHICGFGPMDGTWRGREDVVAAPRRNFSLVSGQQPEIESMISQGDRVAVLLRESGALKSTGEAYSIRAAQWFTFVDGKIKQIDEIVASIWKS